MRVALVVSAFPKLSESFIVNKFLGLLKRGVDAHVVCGAKKGADWGRFRVLDDGEFWRRMHYTPRTRPRTVAMVRAPVVMAAALMGHPGSTGRYLRRAWNSAGSAAAGRLYLDAPLVRLQPDIVHFEFGALAVGRMYLAEALASRVVVSFRGYDLNFSGIEEPGFYEEVWSRADAIHLLGRDLWQRALSRGCPSEKRKWLIPPAVDATFWKRRLDRQKAAKVGSPNSPLRLLSVGRLEWKKGYEFALLTVQNLIEKGLSVEYEIVGEGSSFEAVAFTRHQLGLKQHVRFLGALTREKVREQMDKADIFLHAAVSEGFCNAVLEAQAMELPVVTSDADGLAENVVHGETGFVVPRRGFGEAAERVRELAGNSELRAKLGAAGRSRVEAEFSLEEQIEAFVEMYESVLVGNPDQ